MKLTTLLFLVTIMQVSAASYAQKITLNRDRLSISQVFDEIKNQTGYDVFYLPKVLKTDKTIRADFDQASLEEVMKACLADQPVTYKIDEKTIVISKKEKTFMDNVKNFFSAVDVHGRVTDSLGRPIRGVTVSIKGTLIRTVTDSNGKYILSVPDPINVLVFSFVGFEPQEIIVGNRSIINVIMSLKVTALEEVALISTGYQKIKPEQSTGSVSVIQEKEYNSRINTTDFLTGLQNKIPGLLINNDIQFEGNSLFQIRGISTINGNKQPLIVVDGYPTELSLDMINPNEIESVTVLKDAAAATIYGARSSNGVIIIERKKAKIGKPVVNFRATTSITPNEDYSRYRWDKNGSEVLTEWEKINSATVPASTWARMGTLNGSNYNYNPAALIMYHWRSSTDAISLEERDRQLAELASYNNAADYGRLFLRPAVTQTYNADVSGGTNDVRYYITANYTNKDASQIKNDNSQFKLSGRTTVNFSKRFSLDLTNDFQESKNNSVPIPNINSLYPYERLQDEEGNPLSTYNGSFSSPYYNEAMMGIGLLDNRYYPLIDINEVSNKTYTLNDRIMADFHYKMGKGFNINFGGVYETSRSESKNLASENSSKVHQYLNRYSVDNPDGGFYYNIPRGAFLQQGTGSASSYTLRAQLNYNKQINKDHSLNLIAGSEVRDVTTKSNGTAYFGYNDQTLFNLPVDYNSLKDFSPSYGRGNPSISYGDLFGLSYVENRFISFYTNIVYAYKGKYSLTGSMRIDQSNLFGTDPKYKYKPLWSVGTAWNINKENFMEDISWIKSLKLRMAYGFNGNVAKNALPQVIASDGLNYLDPTEYTPMLTILSYANSGLRWEQTRNFNAGLDFSIFRNITGNIDYYVKQSTDILANNQIDASKGGTSALINQASIRNTGFEFGLQADWITRKHFNWNTGLVFSRNASKVLAVYNKDINLETSPSRTYIGGSSSNYLEGYAVGAMFTYPYAGVDENGVALVYDKDGSTKHFFTNDNGKDDIKYSGSSIPTFNLGFSNRVDIGNFYAYCMIDYYGGFNVRLPVPSPLDVRPIEGAGNYWKQAGDEEIPGILPSPKESSTRYLTYTDRYTVNGAYLTLGDVTAAYSFRDSQLFKKIGITNFEVRLQASNLYTVGFNDYNFSKATGSYEKSYLTPTYTIGLYINL